MTEQLSDTELQVIEHLLLEAGCITPEDKCLLLFDDTTTSLATGFIKVSNRIKMPIIALHIPVATRHGCEPPEIIQSSMCQYTLIIALTYFSLAHTQARVKAGLHGARFLSLPMYNRVMLMDPSLRFNYRQQRNIVESVTESLNIGNTIHVISDAGTNITLNIQGRIGNCCPGYVYQPMDLGSPPDIESNISPIEEASQGVIVIDGSITHPSLGLLETPVKLNVVDGRIVEIESNQLEYVKHLEAILGPINSKRRILAECGIGLNPAAKLTGNMLTDEGAYGCLHFGFGSNITVGGKNDVDFHLDFVFKNATVYIDQKIIIEKGNVLL